MGFILLAIDEQNFSTQEQTMGHPRADSVRYNTGLFFYLISRVSAIFNNCFQNYGTSFNLVNWAIINCCLHSAVMQHRLQELESNPVRRRKLQVHKWIKIYKSIFHNVNLQNLVINVFFFSLNIHSLVLIASSVSVYSPYIPTNV